jgi:hypothetical protein
MGASRSPHSSGPMLRRCRLRHTPCGYRWPRRWPPWHYGRALAYRPARTTPGGVAAALWPRQAALQLRIRIQ